MECIDHSEEMKLSHIFKNDCPRWGKSSRENDANAEI